jgi:hypothetical protein
MNAPIPLDGFEGGGDLHALFMTISALRSCEVSHPSGDLENE